MKQSKNINVLFFLTIIYSIHANFGYAYTSIYLLEELYAPPSIFGIVLGFTTLSGTIASHYTGKYGEKNGYKKILLVCFTGSLLICIGFFISTDFLLPSLLYTLPIYVGLLVAGPALVTEHITESRRGFFMGIFAASQNLGFAIGAISGGLFGGIFDTFRFNYGISAIIALILILYTIIFFINDSN
jgi:MFS family permease